MNGVRDVRSYEHRHDGRMSTPPGGSRAAPETARGGAWNGVRGSI